MVSRRVAAQRRKKRQAALRRSKIRRATRKRAVKVVAQAKAKGISIRSLSKLKRPIMPYIKPQAPAVIAKEVTGISGKLKLIPGLIIGVIIAAYMLLKRR